ncbi:RNA polymerase sigma factor [Terrilactibacillus laevilacticus]|uniref:RNA polymerase sigma factor n=2 Tax=Terrilactibacillus laevilacticus TaxID=1380157 RepID=A0ABW5PUF0_9BACI
MKLLYKTEPIKQIDSNSFEKAIKTYQTHLKGYCVSIAKCRWDGEDLYQETLLKAFKRWKKDPSFQLTKAYLFRIASNSWIDQCRKKSIDIDHHVNIQSITSNEGIKIEEIHDVMERMMTVLTPKQRTVFLLVEGFQLSHDEIAKMINSTEGAVRVTYHRANRKLQQDHLIDQFRSKDDKYVIEDYIHAIHTNNLKEIVRLYEKQSVLQLKTHKMTKLSDSSMMVCAA